MTEITKPGGRIVVYRAVLAPSKNLGDWAVGDLRKFVEDCSAQGIPDATLLTRDRDGLVFGEYTTVPSRFVAERVVDLDAPTA